MDRYVTGAMIKRLREGRGMTQGELAQLVDVGDKAVSRWECGRGYPDITLLEPLASALGVSVAELLAGADVSNVNRSANALRSKLYVCPMCGNVLFAMGEAVVSPDRVQVVKLYPEGDAAARFRRSEVRDVFAYCNRHELFSTKV